MSNPYEQAFYSYLEMRALYEGERDYLRDPDQLKPIFAGSQEASEVQAQAQAPFRALLEAHRAELIHPPLPPELLIEVKKWADRPLQPQLPEVHVVDFRACNYASRCSVIERVVLYGLASLQRQGEISVPDNLLLRERSTKEGMDNG